MAGSRTGTSSIWELSRKIARLKQTYGAADMATRLGPDYAACIDAVVTCVIAVLATDEAVLKIDRVAPYGPEDLPVP